MYFHKNNTLHTKTAPVYRESLCSLKKYSFTLVFAYFVFSSGYFPAEKRSEYTPAESASHPAKGKRQYAPVQIRNLERKMQIFVSSVPLSLAA